MSEGPIKAHRDAWKPPVVSTAAKDRVCAVGTGLNATVGRAFCGRSSAPTADDWDAVSCADCHAARRADEAAS